MKKMISLIIVYCFTLISFAQQTNRVSIHTTMLDDAIPQEAAKNLETKLQRMLTSCNIMDNGADRFILTARVNIISKDVTPTTPARISEKMEITFLVGDIMDNKLYESYTVESSGIGTTEAKAFISAFQRINVNNPEIKAMLERAQTKIIDFYTSHCDDILTKANTLSNQQKYDEAMFYLMSIPDVCSDCYTRCQKTAADIYNKKLTAEGEILLNNARSEWLSEQNQASANRAADILAQINPQSSVYPEVKILQKSISAKLNADAQRAWQLKMKNIEERHKTTRSVIDCVRSIGVAWANHQPTSVVKNIITRW